MIISVFVPSIVKRFFMGLLQSAFKMNILNKIDEDITLLLHNLPVGIVRLNDHRNCVYANRIMLNWLGIQSAEQVCGKHYESIHDDDKHQEMKLCHDFLFDHIQSESTYRMYCHEKSEFRWVTNKRTLLRSSDDCISFMYTIQDIHDTKTMEIQLRNETLRAEQAYNHKSIFLANMSHEIRTPLNGIIGMLTLLEDTPLSTDQHDYIGMVKECSFNLMTIINDILDYSKLEVGKISLDVKTMNLQECIESTNDIILSKVYEKALEYSFQIDSDVPLHIMSDSNRVKQVLLNILSNSIKFTERGTICLNVKVADLDALEHVTLLDESDIFLRFDVTDTGCGIDAKDKEKLFKSFSQVDNRLTTRVYQGTGLGLAISKELVELMGGHIWLDWSEVAVGSRFSFVIKTKVSNEENVVEPEENAAVLNNANVIIVDDNLQNRLSLAAMVTKWGMRPYCFSNGEEALYFTRLTRFDIGLIDICMPKVDGPTFAQKLREQNEFSNNSFPLVALSSLGDKKSSLCKHFKTHQIKPIKEHKLRHICIELLKQHWRHRSDSGASCIPSSSKAMESKTFDNYMVENQIDGLQDNVRILLAEDVYINQRVIISFLNKMGYNNIHTTENGQECLTLIQQHDFDIVLLDIRMPLLNGEMVLKEMKTLYSKHGNRRRPYVVAVTAYCLREDKAKYLNMGFDDYIPKPVSISDLKKCMNAFMEKSLHE